MDPMNPDGEQIPELDLISEPWLPSEGTVHSKQFRKTAKASQVRIHFGCCRLTYTLAPPEHVIRGESDIWRVHCPRCGGLVEVLVQ